MAKTFVDILTKYRSLSFSEHDKGTRFERLMRDYLMTDPTYASQLAKVWMWQDFPARYDLGGGDTGIDLVALTKAGEYWAVQCKCYAEDAIIDKPAVDSFLSTSSRQFRADNLKTVGFSHRLWISTTNKWGPNATKAIQNQNPAVSRINLYDLQEAPINWEMLEEGVQGKASRNPTKLLRPHQQLAVDKTHTHFQTEDRGKLIMACGTGKTFTSLRIAERETDGKGLILFLVPSISLLGQTLREWSAEAKEPIRAICICSDPEVSTKKTKNDDTDSTSIVDLALPASTDVQEIIRQIRYVPLEEQKGMTVVFSTYQSIEMISRVQKRLENQKDALGEFDLIICDEAHRTTGVTLSDEEESHFVKVHDKNFIKAKKRLYMTATPRLYSDDLKSKASASDAILCSMDDPKIYGEEIYHIGFGESVERGLLTDYKVLVLTLSEHDVPPAVLEMIKGNETKISPDDTSKLIGCMNALSKQILGDKEIQDSDPGPMRRSVAYCQNIASSQKITLSFNSTADAYVNSLPSDKREHMVVVHSKHIDGSMSAPERDELMSWLKSEPVNNECRVLTNVRCLSEGVDIPSLDSVMFLSARNSQVDVVQSVGRVMRKSPGKKYGYIIIPVVAPTGIEADKALDDNDRYRVVWTVLNALRAHDDRFNSTINKIELNQNKPDQIIVGRPNITFGEDGQPLPVDDKKPLGLTASDLSNQLFLEFEQLQKVIFARLVKKVGDRGYWERWAKSVAVIAEHQCELINNLINNDGNHKEIFAQFLSGLQKNLNPSITQQDAVEMLSQHIITRPIFEALFENYSFVKSNPVSISMQKMLDILDQNGVDDDVKTLQAFYESVHKHISGIDNAEGKQKIIVELYDKFFKTAFPKMVERLGIVYTPVEVVDFIIHSVNDILKKEFDRSLGDENVHILDPFTGTGTFITRLLQSGLIDKKDLMHKYQEEIHANEIVLLAYYIASVNIENAYHDIIGTSEYKPFEGICLTDTFQLTETKDSFSQVFPENSKRVARQMKAPLRVIMGNPPYSIGQESANDDSQNQAYPKLDKKIEDTYSKNSTATNNKSLYDPYIKAFRWSTDRLDEDNGGIIAFITNSGWIEKNSMDGFRKVVEKEFSSIYVVNLRGAIKGRSGDSAKREGQNVFDIMTGVAITILVKNPKANQSTRIFYYDIGDYLSRKDKLAILTKQKTLMGLSSDFQLIKPNNDADWINQRNEGFNSFFPITPEKKFNTLSKSFFCTNAIGMATNRDSWVYGYSQQKVELNMQNMIDTYNHEVDLLRNDRGHAINYDPQKISWTRALKRDLLKARKFQYDSDLIRKSTYRPFSKQLLYFDKNFIESPGIVTKFFPKIDTNNLIICITGIGDRKGFGILISNQITDLQLLENSQQFPLYYYEERKRQQNGLFDDGEGEQYVRRDGVCDFILDRAHKQYGTSNITKEDIFYYVYGILHSPEYRKKFANDLKKMLPRLPLVEDIRDFWAFSKAGRELAELHINYENIAPPEGVQVAGDDGESYHVDKMRFPSKTDKTKILYNPKITISNIPAQVYEYVVNGKSAIEWIMERYQITTHKESQITNDPNDWAKEVGNPRYILDLLLSVINVSVQTVDIVNKLPKLEFADKI
jgi:predicted helicase